MNSSQVNNAINRLWARGPIKDKPIKVRKATTTHVRDQYPEIREQLAKQMSHDIQNY